MTFMAETKNSTMSADSQQKAPDVLQGAQHVSDERVHQLRERMTSLAQQLRANGRTLSSVLQEMETLCQKSTVISEAAGDRPHRYNQEIASAGRFIPKNGSVSKVEVYNNVQNELTPMSNEQRDKVPSDKNIQNVLALETNTILLAGSPTGAHQPSTGWTRPASGTLDPKPDHPQPAKEMLSTVTSSDGLRGEGEILLRQIQSLLEMAAKDQDQLQAELGMQVKDVSKLRQDLEHSKQIQADMLGETNALYEQVNLCLSKFKDTIMVQAERAQAKTDALWARNKEQERAFVEKETQIRSVLEMCVSQMNSIRDALVSSNKHTSQLEERLSEMRALSSQPAPDHHEFTESKPEMISQATDHRDGKDSKRRRRRRESGSNPHPDGPPLHHGPVPTRANHHRTTTAASSPLTDQEILHVTLYVPRQWQKDAKTSNVSESHVQHTPIPGRGDPHHTVDVGPLMGIPHARIAVWLEDSPQGKINEVSQNMYPTETKIKSRQTKGLNHATSRADPGCDQETYSHYEPNHSNGVLDRRSDYVNSNYSKMGRRTRRRPLFKNTAEVNEMARKVIASTTRVPSKPMELNRLPGNSIDNGTTEPLQQCDIDRITGNVMTSSATRASCQEVDVVDGTSKTADDSHVFPQQTEDGEINGKIMLAGTTRHPEHYWDESNSSELSSDWGTRRHGKPASFILDENGIIWDLGAHTLNTSTDAERLGNMSILGREDSRTSFDGTADNSTETVWLSSAKHQINKNDERYTRSRSIEPLGEKIVRILSSIDNRPLDSTARKQYDMPRGNCPPNEKSQPRVSNKAMRSSSKEEITATNASLAFGSNQSNNNSNKPKNPSLESRRSVETMESNSLIEASRLNHAHISPIVNRQLSDSVSATKNDIKNDAILPERKQKQSFNSQHSLSSQGQVKDERAENPSQSLEMSYSEMSSRDFDEHGVLNEESQSSSPLDSDDMRQDEAKYRTNETTRGNASMASLEAEEVEQPNTDSESEGFPVYEEHTWSTPESIALKHGLSEELELSEPESDVFRQPDSQHHRTRRTRLVLQCVFSRLDTDTLLLVSQVSREWRRVSRNPALWRRVVLKDKAISNQFLVTLSDRCSQLQDLTLQDLRGRGIQANEDPGAYRKSLRACLEPGFEQLLLTCQNSITSLHIEDCDNLLTDRCLWLVSGYCRLLTRLTYRSSLDPINPRLVWALGGGCPGLTALFVQPRQPCSTPGTMNNQCLLMISQLFQDLQEVGLGGKEFDIAGLLPLVTSCKNLHTLHLEYCLVISADLVTGLCRAGLKHLQVFTTKGVVVEAKALQTLHGNCRQLTRVKVTMRIEDCVDDPSIKKNQEKYRKMVKVLEGLKKKAGFGNIFTLDAQVV